MLFYNRPIVIKKSSSSSFECLNKINNDWPDESSSWPDYDQFFEIFKKVEKFYNLNVNKNIYKNDETIFINIKMPEKKLDKNKKKFLEDVFMPNDYAVPIVMQLIYEMYLDACGEYFMEDTEYFFDYLERLWEDGMKFYWTHLKTYRTSYIRTLQESDINFMDKYNDLLITKFGIQNPNKIIHNDIISKCGLNYPPLIGLNKTAECFLNELYDINLYYIYKDFTNLLKIGCDPRFNLCTYYDAGGFIISMSRFVNPNYSYNKEEIMNIPIEKLDVLLTSNDKVIDSDGMEYLIDYNKNKLLVKFCMQVIDDYKSKCNYNVDTNELYFKI